MTWDPQSILQILRHLLKDPPSACEGMCCMNIQQIIAKWLMEVLLFTWMMQKYPDIWGGHIPHPALAVPAASLHMSGPPPGKDIQKRRWNHQISWDLRMRSDLYLRPKSHLMHIVEEASHMSYTRCICHRPMARNKEPVFTSSLPKSSNESKTSTLARISLVHFAFTACIFKQKIVQNTPGEFDTLHLQQIIQSLHPGWSRSSPRWHRGYHRIDVTPCFSCDSPRRHITGAIPMKSRSPA